MKIVLLQSVRGLGDPGDIVNVKSGYARNYLIPKDIAVYATKSNFTLFETSILLFIATISGVLFQGPIGYFSDKFDRRKIIVIVTFLCAFFSFFAIIFSGSSLVNMYLSIELPINKVLFFFSSWILCRFMPSFVFFKSCTYKWFCA